MRRHKSRRERFDCSFCDWRGSLGALDAHIARWHDPSTPAVATPAVVLSPREALIAASPLPDVTRSYLDARDRAIAGGES